MVDFEAYSSSSSFSHNSPHRNKDLGRFQDQGSSENQRRPTPPAKKVPPPPSQTTHSSFPHVNTTNNGPIERISSQQGVSQTPSNSSMRQVFLSLVAALDAHREISTQPRSLQEDHEEALSQIETVLVGEGLQLWQEFCASREYEDEDRVTPEKLLTYVDLICLPFDNMQQDTTNRNRSYPQLVLSLQVLVRPVLQFWVQKASSFNANHTFTEESTAVEGPTHDDSGDMDYQSEYKPETYRDVYNANMDGEPDDDDDGHQSGEDTDGRESVSRLKNIKKEQDSLDALLKRAATPNPVQGTSTSASLAWTPGRYKAGEFDISKVYRTLAVSKEIPTLDIDAAGNVVNILEEWRFGLYGSQAFQDLNKQYGYHWRKREHIGRYHARTTVVCEFKRLVSEEGMDDDEAVASLVARQGTKATTTFCKELGMERAARKAAEKGKTVLQRNPSTLRVLSDPSSSSSDTTKALTSSSAFKHSKPKKIGEMKQTKLWASAGPTPNTRLTEKVSTSEAANNLLNWCQPLKTKVLQYCAPIPGIPETWDKVPLDRTYRFPIFDDIVTVQHLWQFWTQGWQDGPSVRARSIEHGATWRKSTYDPMIHQWYEPRYKIVQQVQKLMVELEWDEKEATEGLEILRSREKLSLEGLAERLGSLYDIPAAISEARNPNAHSLLMTFAESADASREGSGATPFMGHVGGRRSPRTHHLQLNAATQESLLEIFEYDRAAEEEVDIVEESGIQIQI
ncbi:hypothetical protein BGZ95_009224 [Linnemannia exigua]|uniref:Transcription activator GCR1-like domain-containing protein n=1 Tax=Linnemannia exigua TaxID=604196 RepID=A0AAD4DKP2_9FUNG|nr:hypothetical protein BGZ95_009224 [Linnemannia exigua]